MKKIIATSLVLIIAPLLFLRVASAQLLTDTNALQEATQATAQSANFGTLDIGVIASGIIKTVLGFLGIIFIVLITLAGYRWMMAAGNEEDVKKAQDSIKTAIIGLAVVLAAYAITYFVFKYMPFAGGTLPQGQVG